jgi:hypothetical protein
MVALPCMQLLRNLFRVNFYKTEKIDIFAYNRK